MLTSKHFQQQIFFAPPFFWHKHGRGSSCQDLLHLLLLSLNKVLLSIAVCHYIRSCFSLLCVLKSSLLSFWGKLQELYSARNKDVSSRSSCRTSRTTSRTSRITSRIKLKMVLSDFKGQNGPNTGHLPPPSPPPYKPPRTKDQIRRFGGSTSLTMPCCVVY